MKAKEIELFDTVYAKIESLYVELGLLSKKSPNDVINKFKLKYINEVIGDANKLLKEAYKPFHDFIIFEEGELPTSSDVTMILSQYLAALEELRSANVIVQYNDWFWVINGQKSKIKTYAPKKLRR